MSTKPKSLAADQYLEKIQKIRSNPPEVSAAESKEQYLESTSDALPRILTDDEKLAGAEAMRERLRKTRSEQRAVSKEEARAQYLRSVEPPSKWIKPEDY